MRRNYLVITTVSCVFFLLTGCQQQAKMAEEPVAKEAVAKKGEPKIEFESLVYYFGKVGPGKKLNGEFKFTNTGDAPLKIKNVERCCGVVTQLDKKEFKPGESGVLKVQYTSSRTANKITKRLYVNSNDKEIPRTTLTIKVETVLKVIWEPKNIRLLLKDENAGCPPITLTSTDNQPFSITSFMSTGDSITAEVDPAIEATKIVLQPKVDMEKLKKRPSGYINIGLAYPQPDMPTEMAMITFRVLSRFSVSPSVLMFFYDNPQQPIKKYLTITNNYGEEFEIQSTSSKEGHIKVLSQRKFGTRYQFSLEITPPGEDLKKITDTFTINLTNGQTLEAFCRGIYNPVERAEEPVPDTSFVSDKTAPEEATETKRPEPKIKFESFVYDFGEIGPGSKNIAKFKFANNGEGFLKISEVKRCCGVTTKLDKTGYAPGESGVLEVRYQSGQSAGTFNKQIHVISNDRQNPKLSLTLRAKIVPKVAHKPEKLDIHVKGENVGCPEITLSSIDGQPFSIKAFQATSNSITAEVDPSVEATRFVLQPKVDLEKLKQRPNGRILISINHPECNSIYISFRTLLRFRISPPSIVVLNAKPKQTLVRKITIKSNYNEDFEVDSVSSENGFVKVLRQERIDNGYRLEVEVTAPDPDAATGKITDVLYVKLEDEERLEIRTYVRYLKHRASRNDTLNSKTGFGFE